MGVREEYMCVRESIVEKEGSKYSGKGRQLIYMGCN